MLGIDGELHEPEPSATRHVKKGAGERETGTALSSGGNRYRA